MGDKLSLKLDERTVHGKKVAKLRKDGLVPAVVSAVLVAINKAPVLL